MCKLDDARAQLPKRLASIYLKAKHLFDPEWVGNMQTRVEDLREEVKRMDAFLKAAGLDQPESES